MATNGLKSSLSLPETLPPKKRNSRENPGDPPSEHVFKTPSPFWNGFKKFKRSREPTLDSPLDPHLTPAYPPQWPDAASILNPNLSQALADNGPLPSWGHYFASGDRIMGLPNLDGSDPMRLHNFYGSPYYWSYVPVERDGHVKSYHRKLRGQYGPPVVKPIPQSFACHYNRGILSKDGFCAEETRQRFEGERVTQWQEKLHNQRAPQDWRTRKRDHLRETLKWDTVQFTEPGTQFSRYKHYPELKVLAQDVRAEDLSNDARARNEDLHHQQLPVTQPSCSSTEQSMWATEKQAREELPLLARSEEAEAQKQMLSRFEEGSLIELEGGQLKRVEDLKMEDFETCTESCPELNLIKFTAQKITHGHTPGLVCLEVQLENETRSKLTLEVCEGYPFFVCGRGWSSCSPERTAHLCCLRCHQLHLGDMCLALTPVPAPPVMPMNPGTGEGEGGHLDQVINQEKSSEVVRPVKRRKRHHSAPELRNILQCETKS